MIERVKNNWFYGALGASILMIISYWIMLEKELSNGISSYIIACVLYFAFFGVISCLLPRIQISNIKRAGIVAFVLFCLLGVFLLLDFFRVDKYTDIYGPTFHFYHLFPAFVILPFFLFTLAIAILAIWRTWSVDDTFYITRLIIYFLASVLYALHKYTANVFADSGVDIGAYAMSIYNVYRGAPITLHTSAVYGHYAFFYAFFMKIFGQNYITLMTCLAMISFITMACWCYCIEHIIKNNTLKILTAFAVLSESLYLLPGTYWQVSPHRMVFVAIIMAHLIYHKRDSSDSKRREYVGAFIICSLAILWNFETGLFIAISYGFVKCVQSVMDNSGDIRKIIFNRGITVALEIAVPVIIVNIYNYLVGYRKIIFREFFYPLTYMLDEYEKHIFWGNYSYFYMLVIFLITFVWTLKNKNYFGLFIAVYGLGGLTYFANRFVWCNFNLSMTECIFCMALLGESGFFSFRRMIINKVCGIQEGIKAASSILCLLMITFLATINIFSPEVFKSHLTMYNYNEAKEFAHSIEEVVPKNTYAYGLTMPLLYSILDWNTQYIGQDSANMEFTSRNIEEQRRIYNELMLQDSLFVENNMSLTYLTLVELLLKTGKFEVIDKWTYGTHEYLYIAARNNKDTQTDHIRLADTNIFYYHDENGHVMPFFRPSSLDKMLDSQVITTVGGLSTVSVKEENIKIDELVVKNTMCSTSEQYMQEFYMQYANSWADYNNGMYYVDYDFIAKVGDFDAYQITYHRVDGYEYYEFIMPVLIEDRWFQVSILKNECLDSLDEAMEIFEDEILCNGK